MSSSKNNFDPAAETSFENNLLDMLFDRMPMGIAILDPKFNIARYNPTWAEFANRYAPPDAAPLRSGMNYFDRFPGAEGTSIPMFEKVLAGETIRGEGLKFEAGETFSYWDVVLAPLVEDGLVTGILNVTNDATERITLQQNLEKRVSERTRELDRSLEIAESMRDIIGMINANVPLDEFLNRGAMLATERLEAAACAIHQFDLEKELIYVLAHVGMEGIIDKGNSVPFSDLKPRGAENYFLATLNREPTYTNYPPLPDRVDQILQDPDIPESIKAMRATLRERFASSFSVPLVTKDQVYGGMVFYYNESQEFSDDQIQLGLTFAEQVGIAIENARLFAQVEETAVTTERNRLARDLHDAVTQTLFSSSLIADVLPKIWEKDPEEGQKRLEELRQLTSGALSEMRTLLVELRPAAMADADLGSLIGHLVNAFKARTRILVTYNQSCLTNPPLEIKEMFYRIVQEGFNNIAKHASASEVIISLECQPHQAQMVIQDDGIGFDTSGDREGLGLGIMKERAENLGADLIIQSQIGQGTAITLTWLVEKEQE